MERLSPPRKPWPALALGSLLGAALFCLNHLGVLAGVLQTPAGYRPFYGYQDFDMALYLTWIAKAGSGIAIPALHVPALTGDCQYIPFMFLVRQVANLTRLDAVAAFTLVDLLAYLGAATALVLLFRAVLLSAAERWTAVWVILCAIPPRLYFYLPAQFLHSIRRQVLNGFSDEMMSADGLVRGHFSPTLTFGTLCMLLAAWQMTRYAETSNARHLLHASLIAAFSALLHPFEVFLILPASVLVILWRSDGNLRTAVTRSLLFCLPAAIALAPYVYFTLRYPAAAELSRVNSGIHPSSPLYLVQIYGLATLLALLSFYCPREGRRPGDVVLQCFFFPTFVMLFLPRIPFTFHLLDGNLYCAALLAARQVTRLDLVPRYRTTLASCIGVFALFAWGVVFARQYAAGREPDPAWFESSVLPGAYPLVVDWFRSHASEDDLAISPQPLSFWVATAPMHSFASHPVASLRFRGQTALLKRIYEEEIPRDELLRILAHYGARWLVVPGGSRLAATIAASPAGSVGPYRIYEFPYRLKPYSPALLDGPVMAPGAPPPAGPFASSGRPARPE